MLSANMFQIKSHVPNQQKRYTSPKSQDIKTGNNKSYMTFCTCFGDCDCYKTKSSQHLFWNSFGNVSGIKVLNISDLGDAYRQTAR